ncbi:YhcH/YjgK/YiaL family protein [Halanaerobacter jeridensis]|uniref:YhcH/YjgK/YiaL family protein n=1 Tax=Halanaerobacter jeridensis TaxID=706427 RepID=A0A939BPC7_9FIRM|nr:YhcH/YjgK/YiaL family protein [Halanaerobacter jeridensis]MBM7556867.1 YhcH/YjgK/YiaL family protein [Halanaerobacter jeridensis]
MITDSLSNASCYYEINERLEKAFEFLEENDFSKWKDGKYEIDNDDIFAIVDSYQTKPQEEGVWEAHREYIDIQYISEGTELIGYSNIDTMNLNEYDKNNDFLTFEGAGDFFRVKPGNFVVFMPQDVHMPAININDSQNVKKVIIKVKIN